LAAGGALLLLHRRQHRRLDLGSEALKRHHASNHFQRIALRSNRRKPPVRIEESKLPHRPHTRESCCHDSDSHKFAEVAIFRGALKAKPINSCLSNLVSADCKCLFRIWPIKTWDDLSRRTPWDCLNVSITQVLPPTF